MHPPLDLHLHSEDCCKVIKALLSCHKTHPIKKYLGACNDLKLELNKCLHKEYLERRRLNWEASKRWKQKIAEDLD